MVPVCSQELIAAYLYLRIFLKGRAVILAAAQSRTTATAASKSNGAISLLVPQTSERPNPQTVDINNDAIASNFIKLLHKN